MYLMFRLMVIVMFGVRYGFIVDKMLYYYYYYFMNLNIGIIYFKRLVDGMQRRGY